MKTHPSFKVGDLIVITDFQGREFTAEIIEDCAGGLFSLEVETDNPEHIIKTGHESRMRLFVEKQPT